MESIVVYFSNIPSWQRTALLVSGFLFFWSWESLTRRKSEFSTFEHNRINLVFWITTLLINLLFAGTTLWVSFYFSEHKFGLLNLVNMPIFASAIFGILFLDFLCIYVPHWLQHQIPFLWRFHLVHHSDPYINVTTALRHHPGEALLRVIATLSGVMILGVSPGILLLYQTISVFFAQSTHADIRLPSWLDRIFSVVLVTPEAHKVHHHKHEPFTNMNYGNIFSFWDRLFGTYTRLPSDSIEYGVDALPFSKEREASEVRLMLLPIQLEKEESLKSGS
ncbi:hypothetical protein CH373_08975 [Leptospira perolatii]|uniref:Fatty acid hydroxylase domain-containing protein n=1 Tax=Leptospira perolatii TaxID=2023191 RepID=A0A2M9ZNW1_9LEPT|nr:sterol desaturase family protein [Leptospira perolatii]PJZ69626.1 hypothetical protein CH360_10120 [Leptospira perolatii]PJZ73613.1 hypothetical protein CH373_08975 [Leptospira perolatii]